MLNFFALFSTKIKGEKSLTNFCHTVLMIQHESSQILQQGVFDVKKAPKGAQIGVLGGNLNILHAKY
jgi:hypothetical protein